jgi:hypothetical protein
MNYGTEGVVNGVEFILSKIYKIIIKDLQSSLCCNGLFI